MKSKITIFSMLLATSLFAACSGDHQLPAGTVDSAGHYVATNPYRDTFKVTTSTGDATMLENGGNGGTMIVKAKAQENNKAAQAKPAEAAPVAAAADTTKK